MICPGCGSEYSPDNMPNFCPECGRKLTNYDEAVKKAPAVKEQFSFANTVYNVKCPYCKADNEIYHGFGYCSECKTPIHLYINDDCQVAASGKSHNAFYSDLYSAPIPERNGKKVPVEVIIFVIVILVVIVPIIFTAVMPDADTADYYSSYSSYAYSHSDPEYWDYSWTYEALESYSYFYAGDTFVFDDIEFTFGGDVVRWDMVNNEYSEDNGAEVFGIPVTIKNVKDETHNVSTYYINYYGSDDIKTDDISVYFSDSSKKLNKKASEKPFYFTDMSNICCNRQY